ncbi:energy-coupling factor transporter transmembrane protein EcfT [Synechococcus sp. CS-602]|uniref:CbiQ family ECF transporter T component n=1 Tax=Synechococcaceae TaxID=1890426 RepID=UPI0008FF0605|nr:MULTISPECIES: CbiQ family ECF transporter T component [Synechococcaceae]MCT4365373.1 energy-coupling factor transporter transmembrane protein EcfT [Candidatus Regnicoccus frigidus MAG-AL1]APD47577.1 cobalt ABC transporter permease [Synechococcus sp. SynAce01]MCT0201168.1 energy-coupling factor transporter transmembrane protein EcfT [Synechococcus sp. CS-603]MCT0204243.1 energy-coupling factor transporter transmembrane protein EcfT [Synechococcus sp. CS-602]MCT0247084.1 energy-coupling facto
MDWLRQLPIGQFVDGSSSWLRRLDPRLKLGWTLAFLVTPILAGPLWRIALVGLLLLITALSGLSWRLWRRNLPALLALSLLVGLLSALLPTRAVPAAPISRSPQELTLAPSAAGQPATQRLGEPWELLRWGPVQLGPLPLGPLVVNRRSAELGLNSATLLFTLIHSANLLLLSTPPEELVWALTWAISPLRLLGLPVDRLGFTLLLALRFLPLVQEEFQNLLRSLATRAVNLRSLGLKGALGIVLAVGERLLANLLLRAEQGAEALMARGGQWLPPRQLRLVVRAAHPLNWIAATALIALLGLRWQYGAL